MADFKRLVAARVHVSDLLNGQFLRQEDGPNQVVLLDGRGVSRVQIVGIAVSSSREELLVDDGSGTLIVRSFDCPLPDFPIGTAVIVVGRPRAFENRLYVLGEIVKKVDPLWKDVFSILTPVIEPIRKGEVAAEGNASVIEIVRKLDSGDGADYMRVVASIGKDGEEKIVHLLAMGELFETRPGRLKVLE